MEPGGFAGCGICQKVPGCTADAECSSKANGVCIYKKSDCTCGGEKLCHVGCAADKDCGVAQACEKGHCVGKPCVKGSDCPDFFGCFASDKRCGRKNCKKNAECGAGGSCVKKKCYDKPGNCSPVPP